MIERKVYVSPAILTEDVLEQTSLACNATTLGENQPGTYAPGVEEDCTINVAKNNAFADQRACQIVLTGPDQVVALS